ncbi:MAG: hypothetical protein ACOYYJ_17550 [Chloroflexota bacterium]
MTEITCPMCGKPNPPDLQTCQFCDARLQPMTDELSRSQPPIHPGEKPTKKVTAELEPVLPQWLRQVRQQARESAEEETEQAPAQEEAPPQPEPEDLLAGLQSQPEDEEEIPDWLTGLRGGATAPSEEKPARPLEEPSPVESGGVESLPGWISDLGATTGGQEDELTAWLAGDAKRDADPAGEPSSASDSDLGWRAGLEADFQHEAASADADSLNVDLPDWLKAPAEESPDADDAGARAGMAEATALPGEEPRADGEAMPGWLAPLEQAHAPGDAALPAPGGETPQTGADSMAAWLASLDAQGASQPEAPAPPAFTAQSLHGEEASLPAADDLPDWLASLEQEDAPQTEAPAPAAFPAQSPQGEEPLLPAVDDTPDWLASLGEEDVPQPESPASPAFEEVSLPAEGDRPDWLSSSGEEGALQTEGPVSPAFPAQSPQGEEGSQPATGDMPDWLASLEGQPPALDGQAEAQVPGEEIPPWMAASSAGSAEPARPAEDQFRAAAFEPGEESSADAGSAPAFVDDEGAPISSGDVDAIFSLEMPAWLSDVGGAGRGESAPAPAAGQGDELSPADLPSWVQAMRPVEAVLSDNEDGTSSQAVEQKGPLAGLRGVLPPALDALPSSKPKAYSLKLQTSEEQRANAALLEQLLVGETYPRPMMTQATVFSQRILRQIIALVVLLAVVVPIFLNTQNSPVPFSAPLETSAAKDVIDANLQPDALVLMVFDYEAALAGELEAAAAPLVDYMVLLKHPRLAFVSTTPVGAGLSERFIELENTQMAGHCQGGQTCVNLGFLPGGAAGALAFAENPATTTPLTVDGQHAWETPVLQGVQHLSQFAAAILLTDDAETARLWIEQTEGKLGQAHLLVVSSAQAGPMLQPYVQSGQIDGLVVGLGGGAPIEQINSGRPGLARRYWDAYGLGLLVAVTLIALGSLWNLVSAWRLRKAERGI